MTQVIDIADKRQKNHALSDCPQCGALAEVGKEHEQGAMIFCPMCGFMVASVIDTDFAVTAWNDLSKRGRI